MIQKNKKLMKSMISYHSWRNQKFFYRGCRIVSKTKRSLQLSYDLQKLFVRYTESHLHQRFFKECFSGVLNIADGILVYDRGDSLDEAKENHNASINKLLDRCRNVNLKLCKTKFCLNSQSVPYAICQYQLVSFCALRKLKQSWKCQHLLIDMDFWAWPHISHDFYLASQKWRLL